MKVYRLESGEYGVFNGYEANLGGILRYPGDSLYGLYGNTCGVASGDSSIRFGCTSIDSLIEYFGSDFAPLIGYTGVEIAVYEVDKRDVFTGYEGIELAFKIIGAERL